MSRLPDYRRNSMRGLRDMLNDLKQQQNRSQFSPRILASDGEGGMTRDQAIGNDALAGAVIPGVINELEKNFAVTPTWAARCSVNVVVPDIATRLLANCSTWAVAYNPNTTGGGDGAGLEYLYAYVKIGATAGEFTPTGVSGNGGQATASAGLGTLLENLEPGSTVTISAMVSDGWQAIAASSNNWCILTGTLMWLR